MTVSLKKTEVLLKPVDRLTSTPVVVIAGETALPVAQRFCFLGSMLLSDANIDDDISSRIAKASYSFGRLARPRNTQNGGTVLPIANLMRILKRKAPFRV